MHTQKGFTLIELVVSVGILSILAVFLLTTLNPIEQFQKARDGERKSDLAQMQRSLEQYYEDHGSYPASTSNAIQDAAGDMVVWGGTDGWTPYMNLVPKDPDSGRTYFYAVSSDKQKYWLFASLERGTSDPATCKATSSSCQQNQTDTNACNCGSVPVSAGSKYCGTTNTYPCNYGVSSPNTSPDAP